MFFKTGVLKNFADLSGKHLQVCHFNEKRLQHKYFPMKFAKLLRTSCFTEHLRCLLVTALTVAMAITKPRMKHFMIMIS